MSSEKPDERSDVGLSLPPINRMVKNKRSGPLNPEKKRNGREVIWLFEPGDR
jgi:hypothetical protein